MNEVLSSFSFSYVIETPFSTGRLEDTVVSPPTLRGQLGGARQILRFYQSTVCCDFVLSPPSQFNLVIDQNEPTTNNRCKSG
ncbi:hypothetical protein Nepgr_032317 [Nepenthes gracilis]|uniref:Uncharacterized protein n=1 Tax=Nepenthes gracilis TaxID=150966 RepID=A0AAD3TJR6_NEPGR|nr:hypothetical protein Nepgr_032317 [Nepenthes gracilis]